jgi:4-hydroxybutyrate dehydrogenase
METFLVASTMAGIAFGNAGVGAVHAMAYPIGGIYHVPHGKANYLVFSEVFAAYKRLGADLSGLERIIAGTLKCPGESAWPVLSALLDKVLSRQPLSELGADEAKCGEMAASVVQNQQRLLVNNPVNLSVDDIKSIYVKCL